MSTDVTNANNWTGGSPLAGGSDVVVNGGQPNTAVWTLNDPLASAPTSSWSVQSLSIGDGSLSGGAGLLTINGDRNVSSDAYGYGNLSSSDTVNVGTNGGTGVLTLNLRPDQSKPGTALYFFSAVGLSIGQGLGSSGTFNVLGYGKSVQSQNMSSSGAAAAGSVNMTGVPLLVGSQGGVGVVNISDGAIGSLYAPASGPILSIGAGAGSHGTINVLSGGKLNIGAMTGDTGTPNYIGSGGGTGILNVSGVNAIGYASNANFMNGLSIGSGLGSNGSINVLSGGKMLTAYGNLASSPTGVVVPAQVGLQGGSGSVLVDGASAIWYVAGGTNYFGTPATDGSQIGNLQVGIDGTGNVTLSNGGLLSLGTANIATAYNDTNYWYQLDSFTGGLGTLYLGTTSTGSGTLNIGAPAGQAAQAPGTLDAAQIDLGPGSASVVFNHTASNYVFSVPLVGTGTLVSYSGTTYLEQPTGQPTGAATGNSGFSGTTQLYGGALGLMYDGALGSSTVDVLGSGGGLIYGSGTLIGNRIDIAGGATLTASNDNGSAATQGGVISGGGVLLKSGPGMLALTGVNTYTGETDIEGGTLALVGDGSIAQSSRVLDNSIFDISAANADPYIISLAGNGTVHMGGSQLTLTNANDTFAGSFIGSGPLTLAAGTEVLTGNSGAYTGNTTVAGGALWVNGTLGAGSTTVSVDNGGTLGGSGTVGGNVNVASGGTVAPGAGQQQPGALTAGGSLALSGGSMLAYDFGQANTPGGTFNDLLNVGGNLTLAGTINITEAAGGTFEPGIYRVINYNGSLTDLGLAIGVTPVSGLEVQTAIPQQVNLVYSQPGVPLTFWDGDAGPKNNGVIDGGNGSWQASAGNNNWTNAQGTPNAPYADGAFAVFAGNAGTVTIDNSLGAVAAAGLQFATSGYVLQGGTLTLVGSEAYVRVGEGLSRQLLPSTPMATINASIAGGAELIKDDVGTLVLSGVNTYTGGTRIQDGILEVSADDNLGASTGAVVLAGGTLENSASFSSARTVNVDTSGEITTDNGTTLTLSGPLGGSGTLVKSGGGTLDITGNGGFTGPAQVTAGVLSVDGSIPGAAVSLANGTALIGNGTVGATTLQTGATIAPGHSIGTLTVQGSYQQAAGAVYQVQLDPTSANADLIQVKGAATLQPGAALQVSRISNNPYTLGTRYTVLDASGGLSGTFTLGGDLAVSPFATLQDIYDADHAYLQVNQTRSLGDAACTRNPHAAALGLQSTQGGNAALSAIVMDSTSDAGACSALGQLSGEAYASLRGIYLDDSRFLREAVSYRLRDDGSAAGPGASGGNDSSTANGLWAHAFGSWGDYDAHDDTATLDRDIGGVFVGGDREFGSLWRVGVVGGYSHTTFDAGSLNSSGSSDDYHLGLYTGNDSGPFRFNGGLAYTWHDVSMTRHPAFAGYAATLSSDFHAGTAQAWGEIAYDMPGRDVDLQPFFNAAYVRLRVNGFQETGDAATALSGQGDHSANTFSTLGARLVAPLNWGSSSIELRVSAGWRHVYGQLSPSQLLAFAGGEPFGVVGAALDRDALAVDVGLGGRLGDGLDGGLSYSGVLGSHTSDNGVKAYVRWQF
ncbi:autotransporter domain-containing protein [Dyella sp. C9]|uniref:autotransporter domain-containing protein n=1 Tax=Dyella sp. C9 TaxID=2202154 RepID=UPI0018E54A48|nr:autotransporter domain-containing protein [Dyella sp. C9]